VPAYIALAMIWGSSFLFIKIADRAFAPLQVAFGRVLLGAIVVGAVMALRRERLPGGWRLWLHLAGAALLMNAIPYTLLAYGEQRISSVGAGLWNAATPLFALPATIWLIPSERPDRRRIAGLIAGFTGVAILLGATPRLDGKTIAGAALCLGAACSYGIGFPYSRRFLSATGLTPVTLSAGQLTCATFELGFVAVPLTSAPSHVPLGSVLSVIALGAAGTGAAYMLNFRVIGTAGATVASTVAYVMPAWSTAAGVLLLGEPLTTGAVVGAIIIVCGAAMIRPPGRPRDRARRSACSAAPARSHVTADAAATRAACAARHGKESSTASARSC
jgi:drug/metabolite transporter (DMT)-like permease